MKFFYYRYTCFIVLAFISLILAIGGCAPKLRAPVSTLDTPEHHVFTGMKLLETGKLSDAEREFNLAKELDHKYAPAYRGSGLVFAYKGEFKPAFKNMSKAKKLAKSKEEEVRVYVGYMRLYTLQRDKDWLDQTRFLKRYTKSGLIPISIWV
jgi:tetratricopeptide (TPR) repeat protein